MSINNLRAAICLVLVVSFTAVPLVLAAADREPSPAARTPGAGVERKPGQRPAGARFERKPGEVITPPDRGERWSDQIRVGAAAPEFTLPLLPSVDKATSKPKPADAPQKKAVTLRELREKRPVVLIFGSMTCPPFRGQLNGIDQVYEQFQDRAEFLFVYIREAHPDSVLSVVGADGREALAKIVQAADASTRTTSASVCQRTLKLSMPIAVDGIDNAVGKAYAGWPNRMVVVGTDGRVIYASDPSPRGTDAQRLRAWLADNVKQVGP